MPQRSVETWAIIRMDDDIWNVSNLLATDIWNSKDNQTCDPKLVLEDYDNNKHKGGS